MLVLVEEVDNILLVDNKGTNICKNRTIDQVVMELALLVLMVSVEMMIFSLDLASTLVVLDSILDTKLCRYWKKINS